MMIMQPPKARLPRRAAYLVLTAAFAGAMFAAQAVVPAVASPVAAQSAPVPPAPPTPPTPPASPAGNPVTDTPTVIRTIRARTRHVTRPPL